MKVKLLFAALLAVMFATACEKTSESDEVLIHDAPQSQVPGELIGKWLNGTFSMSNWYTYDGKQYLGNPYNRSTAFDFKQNGQAEFFQVIKAFNGSCSTEGFTTLKGTVQFNEARRSFTFYPQSGNYRGFYSCASSSNFNRPAAKEELKPSTYFYSIETDANGQKSMVIRFDEQPGSAASYFKPANW